MMHHHTQDYIHHQKPGIISTIREVVFGMEDGMVSTMGAITGIAAGSGDHFVVILAGAVIISVESISMGIGSFLSNKSQQEVGKRMIGEVKEEIKKYPKEETKEMLRFFLRDGWPKSLALKMMEEISRNKKLMQKEMAYRELNVCNGNSGSPAKNGFYMFVSYVAGGLIPLFPYFIIFDVKSAIWTSILVTILGLFALGSGSTKYTYQTWWKAGLQMLILAGIAGLVGYLVGVGVEKFLM